MNCEQTQDLFAGHLEGLLDDVSADQFNTHLAECADCRVELEQTRRLFNRLQANGRDAGTSSMSTAVMDQILLRQAAQLKRESKRTRLVPYSVAAALLALACLGGFYFLPARHSADAYAAEISVARKSIENAKTATWKTTFYQVGVSDDGKPLIPLNDTRQFSFKAPGHYRDVKLNDQGEPTFIQIGDRVQGMTLLLEPQKKIATLRQESERQSGNVGPFTSLLNSMNRTDLEWLGREKINGHEANGFRHTFWLERQNHNWSYEMWVDADTKLLVAQRVPGTNILDPRRKYGANEEGGGGFYSFDIAIDVNLDDALFSLQPPAGYTVKSVGLPDMTEKDVTDFLKQLAEFCDGTFPSSVLQFPGADERDRFNAANKKSKSDRTAAEDALIETIVRYKNLFIPGPGPTHLFLSQHATEGSWRYIGKGVKLGDDSRILFWYRPKNSQQYRVIYGDLRIKELSEAELPLASSQK